MLHECTVTYLTVFDPITPLIYNHVLKDPDQVIVLNGTSPFLVQKEEYTELKTSNINCFEYNVYEEDPALVWPQTASTLTSFINYNYPNITLTTPGPDTITTATWTKKYWFVGRVKIDNSPPVSKDFTINIRHECYKAHINTVIAPSFQVNYADNV